MEIVHLRAPNDKNGNPRRIWLVINNGEVLHAIDEGYKGRATLDSLYGSPKGEERVRVACQIDVTPGEYNAWKRSSHWVFS